ncbi:MAG TPA: hypothetical protein VFV99_32060 [Kofleriaceae bacterium]|nr:hypothetical protein [Kofleriaceae bacterium]
MAAVIPVRTFVSETPARTASERNSSGVIIALIVSVSVDICFACRSPTVDPVYLVETREQSEQVAPAEAYCLQNREENCSRIISSLIHRHPAVQSFASVFRLRFDEIVEKRGPSSFASLLCTERAVVAASSVRATTR